MKMGEMMRTATVAALLLSACGSDEARWLVSCHNVECENADARHDYDEGRQVVCSWDCASIEADAASDMYVWVQFGRNEEGCFEETGYTQQPGKCDD